MVELLSAGVIRVRPMVAPNGVVDPCRLVSDADDRQLIDGNSSVLLSIENEIGRLMNGSHPSLRERTKNMEGVGSLTDPPTTASPLPQPLSDTAPAPQWL
jgi:hypothetical protein